MACAQFAGSIIAGQITDRFDRRTSAVVSSIVSFVALALVAAFEALDLESVELLAILAGLVFLLNPVFDNATRTMMPALFARSELQKQNGRYVVLMEVGFFGAPVLFGAMIGLWGSVIASTVAAFFFFLASTLFVALEVSSDREAAASEHQKEFEKLDFRNLVTQQWLMAGLFAAIVANFGLLPVSNLFVPARIEELGLSATELGGFFTAISMGFAAAGLLAERIHRAAHHIRNYHLGALILAAVVYGAAYSTNSILALWLSGLAAGLFLGIFEIRWKSLIQENTPSPILGRVYALSSWTSFAGRSAGLFIGGVILTTNSAEDGILALSSATAVLLALQLVLGSWLGKRLLNLRR